MGSPQTVILGYGQPIGMPGLSTRAIDGESAVNSEATAVMSFGIGVKPGVLTKAVLLPTANNSVIKGVTLNSFQQAPGTFGQLSQPGGVIPNAQIEIGTVGRAWVIVDGDTTITPNVTRGYCRFESDGASNTLVGTFRNTDDGHVIDTTKQVLFVSGVYSSADVLSGGTTKIAEIAFDFTIKP